MRKDSPNIKVLMMYSNIFLVLPVIFSYIYGEWIYCFLASGLLTFSPLYHWFKINRTDSIFFNIFKKLDWAFAIIAFIYMYYFVYKYIPSTKILFYLSLLLILMFFWHGYKNGNYEKTHPWFHVIAPIISSGILIAANIN